MRWYTFVHRHSGPGDTTTTPHDLNAAGKRTGIARSIERGVDPGNVGDGVRWVRSDTKLLGKLPPRGIRADDPDRRLA